MKDASFSSTLERLFLATKSKTDSALATALGITAQSVSQAKKKQQIPAQWFIDVANSYGVSVDWLISGRGTMIVENTPNSEITFDYVSKIIALESKVKELEAENSRLKDEALSAYKQAMDTICELALKRGTENIDAYPLAPGAPLHAPRNK